MKHPVRKSTVLNPATRQFSSGESTATTLPARELSELRALIRGDVLGPSDAGYGAAVRAWNLNAVHRPALVVVSQDTHDVRQAVRWAGRVGLGIGVQASGHGAGRPVDGGLLLNTSRLQQLSVDPVAQTARVAAGVRWRDLVDAGAPSGLAGLPGSSTTVGVVGYTLGGGFGWLGRRYGLAAHSVLAAQVVTAEGNVRQVSAQRHPELFWAVPGGLGQLGVVTRLDVRLHPVATVYAGNLYYPRDRLRDLLTFFADWSGSTPEELTAAVAVRRFPPATTVPEPLRGRVFVALRGAYSGDPADGAELLNEARAALGPAVADSFAQMPTARLAEVSADPVDPLPARSHHELLTDLTPAVVDELVELAGAASSWPLVMTEVRQLGGALPGPPGSLSPMAHTAARFSLNAIGVTATPEQASAVRAHLRELTGRMAEHATGDTYLNFLDLDGATHERVRAAFTPADRRRLLDLKARFDPTDVFCFGRRLTPERP